MSHITHGSSGYGYEYRTGLTQVPGIVAQAYRTHRSSGYRYCSRTGLTEVPGIVAQTYITHRQLLWLERTELTEGPGPGMNVVHLTEVPCTGMSVVHNL